jgi:AbrB family looped-hinge helix DNA binding protein
MDMAIADVVRKKSIVSSRGQTVIPKEVREALDIREGATLSWTIRNGKLTVFRIPDDPVTASIGLLKDSGYTFEQFLRERSEEREHERRLEQGEDERWGHTSSTRQP